MARRPPELPRSDGDSMDISIVSAALFNKRRPPPPPPRRPPPCPSCQAERCTADLSHAKRYYRRHKVCEAHSKAPSVVVAGLLQRFCQQCSRFHEISEFDNAKRSCRRRLAGHNERRRKSAASEYQGGGASRCRRPPERGAAGMQIGSPGSNFTSDKLNHALSLLSS